MIWSQACLISASHSLLYEPFDWIGVDVTKFPHTGDGNQYTVVFMVFLMKWPKVFSVSDQSAAIIAKLLVEQIKSSRCSFRNSLRQRRSISVWLDGRIGRLLSFHKVNTTIYHPQADGLVEHFNCT